MTTKTDFEPLSQAVLEGLGGADNVSSVTHCATRLRFKIKDASKVNESKIADTESVITLMKAGGQHQVVIGNDVPFAYDAVVSLPGMAAKGAKGAAVEDTDEDNGEKPNALNAFIQLISSLFTPIAKPGQPVTAEKVTRTFRPENERDSDNLAQQLAALDPRFLAAADDALRAEFEERGSATVVALADHLRVAAVRVAADAATAAQPHPLTAEVKHLYPAEYAAGERILTHVNKQLELDLPQVEAVAIAMPLVNASFHTDGLAETYRMTGVFGQLFDIIDTSFDIELDRQSISAARFITHMRYFFVRVNEGRQLNEGMSVLKDGPAAVPLAGGNLRQPPRLRPRASPWRAAH